MNIKIYLKQRIRFLFRKKNIACLILVCCAAGLTPANESFPQYKAVELRQLIKQAEKLTRRGDFPEAEKILRGILDNNPKNSSAKLALGNNLLKQKRIIEAYTLSLEVAQTEPKNSYAFAVLGTALLNAGRFSDAKLSLINAINLDNGEALAWASLGLLDFYENKIAQGLENLRTAVYLEPNEPDFVYSLAQVAARDEHYKESADAYRTFLRISPRTDLDRRERIKGLIDFLEFLGNRERLYLPDGEKRTKVSFKLKNDRPVIEVRLNKSDAPLNFVLDTGAGISVLSEDTAKKLNIKPVASGGSARGVGGNGKFDIVYGFLKSLYIGDVKIKNVPIYIRKFHSANEAVDGYIGLSLISKFLTTIDYGNNTFELVNKNTTEKRPVDDNNLSFPLRLTSSGFLSGEVQLEGIETPLNFIVDTGASVSVISEAVAQMDEVRHFVKDEKMRIIGAAGVTESAPSFLLPRVTFGNHSRQSIKAVALNLDVINETSGFEQAGILGGNFLKNYRLTFDFENSKVIFVPIN